MSYRTAPHIIFNDIRTLMLVLYQCQGGDAQEERSGRLTLFPASAFRFSTDPLKLIVLPVKLPPVRLPIGIVTLKNRSLSPVAQLFIEHAREVAKPFAKTKR